MPRLRAAASSPCLSLLPTHPSSPLQVREAHLAELPAEHMFVGRTPLTIADIRAWNTIQEQEYELHRNDCRHYVNSLVAYTTGAWAGG